jgi:hypothetical protein
LLAWLLLGQLPSPVQFLGGAFILAGIVLVRASELRSDRTPATAEAHEDPERAPAALALWQVSRRTALVMVPSCLAVWFSVVFLGQHYVIDVTGGVVLAVVAWAVMMFVVAPHVRALPGPCHIRPGRDVAVRRYVD